MLRSRRRTFLGSHASSVLRVSSSRISYTGRAPMVSERVHPSITRDPAAIALCVA